MLASLSSWLPAILLAALPFTAAQVKSDCNPMERDCPDNPALGIEHLFHFNSSPPHDTWEQTASGKITYDSEKGAIFTLSKQGESPTLRTKFYFFGGRSEMHMKCAPGQGIITSMMWLSDTLDEVDWEFFGTNASYAASNYFGKGDEDFSNGEYHDTGFNIYDDYHNYTSVWTEDKLEWWVDGDLVRTLVPDEANGGKNFPQTPMRLSLGVWAGGDPRLAEGTRQWAGGTTDYDEGPFEMYVKSIKITDFSEGSKEYVYRDRSGMWDSIEIVEGNSTAVKAIFKEPKKSLSEKWNALPQAARIAVYAGGAALAGVIILAALFYFFRQRRRGVREAKAAAFRSEHELGGLDAKWRADDGTVGEKAFEEMGPRPDNSWPEEGGHTAPLLGNGPPSPGLNGGFSGRYDTPQSPPRSARAAPQSYDGHGYGYDGPQSPPRSASAAPQGYGYGGPGYR